MSIQHDIFPAMANWWSKQKKVAAVKWTNAGGYENTVGGNPRSAYAAYTSGGQQQCGDAALAFFNLVVALQNFGFEVFANGAAVQNYHIAHDPGLQALDAEFKQLGTWGLRTDRLESQQFQNSYPAPVTFVKDTSVAGMAAMYQAMDRDGNPDAFGRYLNEMCIALAKGLLGTGTYGLGMGTQKTGNYYDMLSLYETINNVKLNVTMYEWTHGKYGVEHIFATQNSKLAKIGTSWYYLSGTTDKKIADFNNAVEGQAEGSEVYLGWHAALALAQLQLLFRTDRTKLASSQVVPVSIVPSFYKYIPFIVQGLARAVERPASGPGSVPDEDVTNGGSPTAPASEAIILAALGSRMERIQSETDTLIARSNLVETTIPSSLPSLAVGSLLGTVGGFLLGGKK